MRRLTVAWILAAVLAAPAAARAQTFANLERQLLPLQEGVLKNAPGVDAALWDSLAFFRAQEDRQRAMKGDVTFGLTGDAAGSRSLVKLNTGISLSRGVFPSEITVNSLLGLVLSNGQIQEDVTNLKISYDYHTTRQLEYFAFAERFSDNFLSIQQRYEIGFGARVGLEFGRVGDWRNVDRQVENLERNLPGVRAAAASLPSAVQTRLRDAGVFDQARFDLALERLEHVVRDDQTRLFLGLAAGVFAEIEHAAIDVVATSVSDSSSSAVRSRVALDGTERYRLNLRPTIRFRPLAEVLIRVYPYWKLPIDGPRRVTLPDGTRRLDYRRDVLSELTWSLRPEETGLESVDFVFTYNHFFDNVPPVLPTRLVADTLADGRVFDRVSADRAHRFVSMSLRVHW